MEISNNFETFLKYFSDLLIFCIVKYRIFWILFENSCILKTDNKGMEGMTVSEIAKELEISVDAVRKRIETAKIKPISREAVYDKEVVKILKDIKMGRPRKAEPEADGKT